MPHATDSPGDAEFIVRRDSLLEFKIVPLADRELGEGEVELSVDRFAFTSNNVTYGAIGEAFSYWNFFPASAEGWGIIPVWGFGTVARSTHAEVAPGERFYGYYPMATRLVVSPSRVSPAGFSDGTPHRQPMSAIYNRYQRTTTDPDYRPEDEAFLALFRPLFATAFLIDDMLAESGFFGAGSILFSSASSKTAYSTALLLSERRKAGQDIESVGLTSKGNADFVKRLEVYDRVVCYEDIAALPRSRKTAFFDIAGSAGVRGAVHRHFADALTHSSIVGRTHWSETATGAVENLPGVEPSLFFAPTWMRKRMTELTPSVLEQRLRQAWQSLLAVLRDPAKQWVDVVEGAGPRAVERVYADALAGRLKPEQGHVLSLRG
jgi:hypothetical protein